MPTNMNEPVKLAMIFEKPATDRQRKTVLRLNDCVRRTNKMKLWNFPDFNYSFRYLTKK